MALLLLSAATLPAAGQEILQDRGFLQPFDQVNTCDQGETHFLWNPCTGDSTWVLTLTTVYDCQHVYVQGPDVGITEFCPMIWPQTIHPVAPDCLVQVRGVKVRPVPGGHRVNWELFGCSDSFDVIRGTVSSLTTDDVGAVLCIADDRIQVWADDLTGAEPAPGEAFFYLVRPNGPAGFAHYGYSSSGAERYPASGDCPAS
jgi:hypothetical protein